jgi:hypothetical protein
VKKSSSDNPAVCFVYTQFKPATKREDKAIVFNIPFQGSSSVTIKKSLVSTKD